MRKFLVISLVLVSFSVFAEAKKTVGETITPDVVWDKACNCNVSVNAKQERANVKDSKKESDKSKDVSAQ